jgi:hypothetical protein
LRERGGNALALIVVLALAMAFFRLDPLGLSADPLRDDDTTACDGDTVAAAMYEALG